MTGRLPKRGIEAVAGLVLAVAVAACAGGEGKKGVLGISTPSASPERPVPTKTAESTVVPMPIATARPTPTATATPEKKTTEAAFFDLGNLRVEITDWQEPKRKGSSTINGVAYKPVEIIGTVRNVGPKTVDLRILKPFDKEGYYDSELVSKQGNVLSQSTSGMQQEIFWAGELNKHYKSLLLPSGFGIPVRFVFEIPPAETGYQLKVQAKKPDVARPSNFIKQNEVMKSSLIALGAEIRNSNQQWDYPTLSLAYSGVFLESIKGTARSQKVQFSVRNNKNEPIRGIDVHTSMKVLVYLKDGRVVYGSESSINYAPRFIQPGATSNLRIEIGFDDSGYEDRSHFGIFDLKGSVVLLMLDSGEWAAWRVE